MTTNLVWIRYLPPQDATNSCLAYSLDAPQQKRTLDQMRMNLKPSWAAMLPTRGNRFATRRIAVHGQGCQPIFLHHRPCLEAIPLEPKGRRVMDTISGQRLYLFSTWLV
jgi:hypothetical protein